MEITATLSKDGFDVEIIYTDHETWEYRILCDGVVIAQSDDGGGNGLYMAVLANQWIDNKEEGRAFSDLQFGDLLYVPSVSSNRFRVLAHHGDFIMGLDRDMRAHILEISQYHYHHFVSQPKSNELDFFRDTLNAVKRIEQPTLWQIIDDAKSHFDFSK